MTHLLFYAGFNSTFPKYLLLLLIYLFIKYNKRLSQFKCIFTKNRIKLKLIEHNRGLSYRQLYIFTYFNSKKIT